MFEVLMEPVNHLFRASDRIYWVYLLSAIVIAFFIYARSAAAANSSLAGFFRYCFPAAIWRHASSKIDLRFFLFNRILFFLMLTPVVTLLFPIFNTFVQQFWLGLIEPPNWQANSMVYGVYGGLVILGLDFLRFFTHYLQHRVPFLWQFHRLHHSAEVLNPLTVYRMHPVDDLFILIVAALYTALLHGTFSVLFVNDFSFATFGVLSLVTLVFYVAGYNLRHSHIWLTFGDSLGHWLISPAHHQIHHSCLPQHQDRNMGFMLAVWDRAFGTLYVPRDQEKLEPGVDDANSETTYASILSCYAEPFRKTFSGQRLATISLVSFLGLATSASVALSMKDEPEATKLWLGNLTSPEVASLIKEGWRTVIVPTGGLEYNGAHLTLGKHQSVIAYAAEALASELGNALIAPVIAYVPEGNVSPPSGHMVHSGTITVRVTTFEALLEDTTRSLFQHGFDRVLFIGDSGWNQDPQMSVATKLTQEFNTAGKLALHLSDYYENNDQTRWLETQGFTAPQIGFHAGIRDSSELIYVNPNQVRTDHLMVSGQKDDVSGSYWKATAEIGQKMLELKVAAAVNQIQNYEAAN